jgi:UDP-N-acetylglucosamine--N-acetylmuramyl-(pentapeptide) pyrophosphoryl-undecaprenol N-acetylglucosamine transferase
VDAQPVGRLTSLRGLRGLLKLAKVQKEARRLLDEFRPDVVFGTGGYAAAPVLLAQRRRGGPYVLHEQNSIAGRTNRVLGRRASAVCIVFESVRAEFPRSRVVVTGMPLRDEAIRCELSPEAAREKFGLAPDRWTVHVYGGSQGAQALNEVVLSAAQHIASSAVQWLHVTGERHIEAVRNSAEALGLNGNHTARGFLSGPDVGIGFRAASIAIVRCGASTLSEVMAWGLPSIMVPLPTSWANHQYHNARVLADAGAGRLCPQSALSPALLAEWIQDWQGDPQRYAEASAAARSLFRPDAVETISGLLREVAASPAGAVVGRKAS